MTADRSFVPFESLWNMAVDVPYSYLVRDGGLAWTCGQIALDESAAVVAPDDAAEQTRLVADQTAEILRRAGVEPSDVARLVAYHCVTEPDREAVIAQSLRDRFGADVLVDLVRVPPFYYDGLVVEVDSFVGRSPSRVVGGDGTAVEVVVDERLAWVSLAAPPAALADALEALDVVLADLDLNRDQLLSSHWYAPTRAAAAMATRIPPSLLSDPGALVMTDDDQVSGLFVFDRTSACAEWTRFDDEAGVVVTTRDGADIGWIRARSNDASLGLVEQTAAIMDAIEQELGHRQRSFESVVKSTTYYVGGSSADELHDNLLVRNRRYSRPGPASTGLPIFGLADARSRITVDVVWR